jgi:hypothetical protein
VNRLTKSSPYVLLDLSNATLAISRAPRREAALGRKVVRHNRQMLTLTLTMFGQVFAGRAQDPLTFPTGQARNRAGHIVASIGQPIVCAKYESLADVWVFFPDA